MTEKAERILDKIRKRTRRHATPGKLDGILEELNKSTLDDVGPVAGGDQELKVLKEMNDLQEFENQNWSKGKV